MIRMGRRRLQAGEGHSPEHRKYGAEPILDDIIKHATRSAKDDERERHIEKICQSSVKIETKNSEGSGVIIGTDHYRTIIMTNRHVIDPAYRSKRSKTLEVMKEGRSAMAQRILIAPHGLDLAIIEVRGELGAQARISFTEHKPGAKVVVVGAGLGFENAVSMGIVSKLLVEKTRTGFEYDVIHTDAQVNLGNSGGGIFRFSSGELIGVVTYKLVAENKQLAEGGFAISIGMLGKIQKEEWKAVPLS